MDIKIYGKDYVEYLENTYEKILSSKEYVTALDSELGDGDHWINMNMGFEALMEKKNELSNLTPKELLKNIGVTMMSVIGGSSGVLYGSAYIRAAKNLDDVEYLTLNSLYNVLDSELSGMMERGQAKFGDKTMIDPLYCAVEEFKNALNEKENIVNIANRVKNKAKDGMEKTKDMEAKKGRGRYREDKGVGHIDAGAVTMYYQIDELMNFIIKKVEG